MADIEGFDGDAISKQEIMLRLKLDITRMNAQIEENEFKLFQMDKNKKMLQTSIEEAKESIKQKQIELDKCKKDWNM